MGSPEVVDFDRLLGPIPGDNPAGVALREDFSPTSEYHAMKDARAAARAAERNVVWDDDEDAYAEPPNWRPILELGPKILAEQSKDLEIAAWLTEGLLRRHGFAGLRDGFRLARELVERFWDHLYPVPDEDGMATRVAPLAGLNGVDSEGVLINPISNVPLTDEGTFRALNAADYQQAQDLERTEDPDRRAQRIDQGAASMQMFDRAVSETAPEFFRALAEDLQQCCDEFDKMGAALEAICPNDSSGYSVAPPSSNIRNALQACQDTVQQIAGHLLVDPEAEEGADGQGSSPGDGASGGRVNTREGAFLSLLQVAEFFKRTEPHSPISYALEQAVRWGRMPLPDLWSELIPEEAARLQLFKLVGIQPPGENS
ncbi:MAG: type VI secretion system protein TssA [Planctomycetes bacterium]|nr:type VI secretion system protein TssA [Planctomycetota bacterium]